MKIGILLSRVPYPLEKGDKLRAYHQIKVLSKKHEIYLCAMNTGKLHPAAIEKLSPFCKEIKIIQLNKISIFFKLVYCILFTKLPLQVAYFFKKNAKKSVQKFFISNKVSHIYCQLIRVCEYVKDLNEIPKTLDYMDALSRGMERRIEKSSFFLKPVLQLETTRLKQYEHFVFPSFQQHSIISEQDRMLIVHADNHEIEIIRNGVDQSYFKAVNAEKSIDLLFTGNMAYPPNVDGVCYIVNEIMPLVWKEKPEISLAIVGANPTTKVLKLASERVTVTGWVNDMREYYAKSRLFVAPMLIGTGLQNKLLEAMAMNVPCITTPLANNALQAKPDKDILIADQPEKFKKHIFNLLTNPKLADEIAENAHTFVGQKYSWENSTAKLEQLFESN